MIKRNVIKPYIQPIVNRDGVVIGGEVLSRWIDSKGNIVSPLLFIPDLMKYNLIPLLTHSLLVQFYNFIEDKDIQRTTNKF
ncbi:EAL domain-containing protein [Photobacterium leiognathi]|uniref:EAL domain-containing protein n=1 Tax=Photobacterium leiognathi TaxID=553611 RepID=UPI0034E937BE